MKIHRFRTDHLILSPRNENGDSLQGTVNLHIGFVWPKDFSVNQEILQRNQDFLWLWENRKIYYSKLL